MADAKPAVEYLRDRVTNCDLCAFPHEREHDFKAFCAAPYMNKTDFVVEGYGSVPVVNGDPKWLPIKVRTFLGFHAKLMRPAAIHICNGSFSEAEYLTATLEQIGVLEKLIGRDNVFVARTDPQDSTERPVFICSTKLDEIETRRQPESSWAFARWISPSQFYIEAYSRFPGCMQGRVMYVIPFSMGPIGGRYSINAVQLTDSPYVVLNMRILTRVSSSVWDAIGQADFVRCIHSIGRPRPVTELPKCGWICNPDRFFLAVRPSENDIWSFGSAFGENAFLSKKCLGLRLASYRGWKEGWLALNAALIAVKGPSGKEVYGCVSLPVGVGKTQIASMTSAGGGWQVRVLGDDITWIKCGPDRVAYALAPENGMFGCPSSATPKNATNLIKMLNKNAILTNCATTSKGRYFWEGLANTLTDDERVTDWTGDDWKPSDKRTPNHLNCRYSAFMSSAPNLHHNWDYSAGVPISFIVFGCERKDQMPLVYETESWEHGVAMAAGLRTISHSALDKPTTALVHNPMCMRTYFSFNFADFVKHWVAIKEKVSQMPKVFMVNWYQEGSDGKPIWPGFGENIRVLEWIVKRCIAPNETPSTTTAIGMLPQKLNTEGLNVDTTKLFTVNKSFWIQEIKEISAFLRVETKNQTPPIISKILADISKRLA
ncbi:Phosphoenolpyruvate carboxykinase GTP [Trichostrongylus colubriformis]|uniref:phosphoenolpyruvate carboxykinase (GTP) n=1 Tax=Trichostrongylus colubriformis TaxID=6319 RepID=A0AAN8F4H8_TRICO